MSTNNYIKYKFHDAKSVVVSGDIHGDFIQLVYKCCIQYGMTDTVIIVAGDCGFGFEKPGYYENLYKRSRERLSKTNNWLLFVRGNHDNPGLFQSPAHQTQALDDTARLFSCESLWAYYPLRGWGHIHRPHLPHELQKLSFPEARRSPCSQCLLAQRAFRL